MLTKDEHGVFAIRCDVATCNHGTELIADGTWDAVLKLLELGWDFQYLPGFYDGPFWCCPQCVECRAEGRAAYLERLAAPV